MLTQGHSKEPCPGASGHLRDCPFKRVSNQRSGQRRPTFSLVPSLERERKRSEGPERRAREAAEGPAITAASPFLFLWHTLSCVQYFTHFAFALSYLDVSSCTQMIRNSLGTRSHALAIYK